MTSMTMTLPVNVAANACDQGLAFLGAPAQRSAKKHLTGSTDEVVRTIVSVLDGLVKHAMTARDGNDFQAAFDAVFPKYVSLSLNLGAIISTLIPEMDRVRLTSESFSELEADIREHAVATFGEEMKERALFTVWTLRKTSDLLQVIVAANIEASQKQRDRELYTHFAFHALRSRFGVDCLRAAFHHKGTLYPGVLDAVEDCLRSAVDAYAWAKQASTLRMAAYPHDENTVADWDDDDEELMRESMNDLAREDGD